MYKKYLWLKLDKNDAPEPVMLPLPSSIVPTTQSKQRALPVVPLPAEPLVYCRARCSLEGPEASRRRLARFGGATTRSGAAEADQVKRKEPERRAVGGVGDVSPAIRFHFAGRRFGVSATKAMTEGREPARVREAPATVPVLLGDKPDIKSREPRAGQRVRTGRPDAPRWRPFFSLEDNL